MEKILIAKEYLIKHKYWIILGFVLVLLLMGSGYYIYQHSNTNEFILEEEKLIESEIDELVKEDIACMIKVDVKGEVENPGLYELDCDSRVQDAINLAGGLTNQADTSTINLGKKMTDEMVIIVSSKKQIENEKISNQENGVSNAQENLQNDALIQEKDLSNSTVIGDTPVKNLISLNSASKEELMTLSGIGESKADSIIEYRTLHNGFQSIEEIKNVKGIGDSIFDKIKNDITL